MNGTVRSQSERCEIRRGICFSRAGEDGQSEDLQGDWYLPPASSSGAARRPVVIAAHGGAWKSGDRSRYRYLAPRLAEAGYAVFAIDYKLVVDGQNRHPAAALDLIRAIRFVVDCAEQLSLDRDRIVLMGDSAGAHLSALVALGGVGSLAPRDLKAAIAAVVGVYGVYDLLAQWQHDQLHRPLDSISERLLGVAPMHNRLAYHLASPINYVTHDKRAISFFLAWGACDDIAAPAYQSEAMLIALKQAEIFVRTLVVPGAGHFWIADPIDEAHSAPGLMLPALLRFLEDRVRKPSHSESK